MQDALQITQVPEMPTFMNVLVDYAFKRIFGNIQNKSILISMLNSFLSEYVGEITDIELLPTEQLGISPNDKKMSYDVYSKEGEERRFLLEMQRGRQTFYSRRAIAYVSRAVSNELKKGDREYNFPSVISLNFMEYHDSKIMGKSDFVQRVMLKNEQNENFSEKIMFIFVDLSIFADGKTASSIVDERKKWAYYIRNIGHLSEGDVKDETGVFRDFIDQCRMSNLNKTEMREYKKSIMEYADVQDACVAAMEDGIAEGEARGREAGLADAKRTMALEMLKKGIPLSLVSDITGLSEKEVRQLTIDS